MSQKRDLSLVIPVYNEDEAIAGVLDKWTAVLDDLKIDYQIHAYNDGSKDSTGEILAAYAAKNPGRVVAHDKPNSGHGPTILQGYRESAPQSEWLFQIDSDDEMGPEKFGELWEKREEYDFLLGKRDGREQPLPRKIISAVSRGVAKLFYGPETVWDVNSPYRLMRSEAFCEVFSDIPADTFAPNVIISGSVASRGLRYFEMPVPQRERQTGEVSIKKWKLLKAAMRSFGQTIAFSLKRGEGEKVVGASSFPACFFVFCFILALFTCRGFSWYNDDWSTYGVNLLARIGFFENYFVAQSVVDNGSPQMFTDMLVVGLIKAGLSYKNSVFVLMGAYIFVYVVSFLLISKTVFRGKYALLSLLVVFSLTFTVFPFYMDLGCLQLCPLMTISHASLATAMCCLGMLMALRGRCGAAYLLTGIGVLFQLQVGFYFGVALVAYQFMFDGRRPMALRKYLFLIWLSPVLYLVITLTGGEDCLTSKDFFELYGVFRHPHHMIPAAWPKDAWLVYAVWSVVVLYGMKFYRMVSSNQKKILLFAALLSVFMALVYLGNFFFTSVIPLAFCIKLQPARMLLPVLFFQILAYGVMLSAFMKNGKVLPAAGFLAFALLSKKFMLALPACAILFDVFCPMCSGKVSLLRRIRLIVCARRFFGLRSGVLMLGAVLLLGALSWRIYRLDSFTERFVDKDLYRLAQRFRQSTPKDTVFITNPFANPAFTLFSRRTPVAFWKNIPIHEKAILTWRERLMEMSALSRDKDGKYHGLSFNAEAIVRTGIKYNAEYILADRSSVGHYINAGVSEVVDEEGHFFILKFPAVVHKKSSH